VRVVRETEYPEWNQLVVDGIGGSIYSTPEYLDIICSATGASFRILGAYRGDELVGGVGLYETNSAVGRIVSNRLLLYYNGIVLREYDTRYPSERTSRHLVTMDALERRLASSGYVHLLFHNRADIADLRPFVSNGWVARPSYTYVVDITDISETWNRIEQNQRRLIKRCESEGATITDDDDFDAFFALHYQTHERKGAPLYLPKDSFTRYFERLRQANLVRLFGVRLADGKMIAGQLVLLGKHPVCHTVCAGAEPDYLKIGSTPFLRWKAFEKLSAMGYEGNDLTDAALNPVTRFKSQLGGQLEMGFVLSRPDSFGYRIYEGSRQLKWRSASVVRSLARRLVGRKDQ
jgi:hypothetical protein